jgi:hypothetical protein
MNSAADSESTMYQFARPAAATRAAAVLGTTLQTLSRAVFGWFSSNLNVTGLDMVESFVSSLYANILHAIATLINRFVSNHVS